MFRTRLTFLLVFAVCWATSASTHAVGPPAPPRFPLLSDAEACQRLPGAKPPLPAWARALAASLPQATAAMLRLDYLHRARNPLGPVLAAKLRWAATDALGCDYAKRYAEADLRRHGLSKKDLRRLTGDCRELSAGERAALAFARKLTRAAQTVTDAEVAALLEHFGAEKVVAMVHTVAHANFQGRIVLALNVEVEPGGPLPPLEIKSLPTSAAKVPATKRPPWANLRKVKNAAGADSRPTWDGRKPADLARALREQKGRKSRIPLPSAERLARLPLEAKAQATRIVWMHVSVGYQPILTRAWFDCMQAFGSEGQLDRVFANSMFWVVTRSTECFY
jgi:alkylhydroperoxidase family enzyme